MSCKLRVAVIDGQGGGIGSHIVERLRRALGEQVRILALGTNAIATSLMLRAGANEGASGEGAVCRNADRVDIITGPLAIVLAHSMLGEFTPRMAEAVAASPARKLLLPLNRYGVEIIGVLDVPLPHQVDALVGRISSLREQKICSGGEN